MSALERQVNQLITRMRDLEAEVARLRSTNPDARPGIEAAIVSIETDDSIADPLGPVSDTDDTQTIHSAQATVMEFIDDGNKLKPIQNADREERLTLTYWNAATTSPDPRDGSGDCFIALRMRDGRWVRVSGSGTSLFRFTLLEDTNGAPEEIYFADIFSLPIAAVAEDAELVDTYGWMSDLQLRAGDEGLCARAGGKYYFVDSGCGSIGECTDGPFLSAQVPTTGTVDESYTWSPEATGDNAPDTWAAEGLPAGLEIDEATGEITGTPTESGKFLITLTAGKDECIATKIVRMTIDPEE